MIDGPTLEQIPLDRLYGPAVIWRIEKGPYAVITPEDFEAATPKVQPGDMVLLDTGWAQYINTEKYEESCLAVGRSGANGSSNIR